MHPIIEQIRLRYDLKREYFTLYVPVVIAVLMVLVPFALGATEIPHEGGAAKQDTKLQAYQELASQLGEEGLASPAGAGAAGTASPDSAAAAKIPLDQLIILAVLVAITPYAIDMLLEKRRSRRMEELFTEFLFKLSELMRGGLDPVKGVIELSRTDLGELTPYIRIAATGMTYGKTFDEAMRATAGSLKSELISRYVDLVIQASTSGGSVADLILRASEDMRGIIGIEREKEGNLSQYTFIFYFAQGILVFIAYILSTSLLSFVQQLGAQTFFGTNDVANLNFRLGFFHLLIINSFFGGLIIGKISEGESRYGLKHAVVLIVASYIACVAFILPVPPQAPTGSYNVIAVSGGNQEGFPNLPLKDPLVFQVNDRQGKPVNSTTVLFSILPSGTLNPSVETTDTNGRVSVKVTIGSETGNYIIVATAGSDKGSITIPTSASSNT